MLVRSRCALAGAVLGAVVAAGCAPPLGTAGKTTLGAAGSGGVASTVGTFRASSGDGQSGQTGEPLPDPLTVIVLDKNGHPLAGANVGFVVASGGGTVSPPQATTGADGHASTVLTLGSVPGKNFVLASIPQVGATVSFTANAIGSPAELVLASGNGQTGTVGTTLATPLAVTCVDAIGQAVPGVAVAFAVAGGGTISSTGVLTDRHGVAQVTLTLGQQAGQESVTATAAGTAPVSFAATATAAPAASMSAVSGNGQTGPAGATLQNLVGVRVADANGNPVSGIVVTFAATSGGGVLLPATVATDTQGEAFAAWKLGTSAGPNTAAATAGALSGSPVLFTATALAGNAGKLLVKSGGGQTGVVGTALAGPLVALAIDANGNPVSGSSVSFAVATGNGSVSPQTVLTDSQGLAATTFTLGTAAGAQSVAASCGALAPVTFAETAQAGSASSVNIVKGDAQTGTVGSALPSTLGVAVHDAFGNAVAGATVTFTVTSGSATVSPATPITDAGGLASTAVTLGSTAGTVTIVASVPGATPATFSETALAGSSYVISAASGQGQSGPVGTPLPSPCTVLLQDGFGNPVSGVAVSFTTTDGTVAPTSATTDANGQASTVWTLGGAAGSVSMRASTSRTGLTFTATATSGAPTTISLVSGDRQTGTVASALALPCVVAVVDSWSNPVPGVAVAWTVSPDGGSVDAPSTSTDATGHAQTTLTLGTTAEAVVVTATANGLAGSPVSFHETADAGTVAKLVFSVLPADGAASWPLSPSVEVDETDAYGNPTTTSISVTLAAPDLSGTTTRSTVSGKAIFSGLVIGHPARGVVLSASSNGLPTVTSAPFDVGLGTGTTMWASLPPLGTARDGLAAGEVGGTTYALGGEDATGAPSGVVETWAPGQVSWTTSASLATPRAWLAGAVSNGSLYAIGGATAAGATASVEVLDPAVGTWTSGPSLLAARSGLGAAATSTGRIYAIGGLDAQGVPVGNVETLSAGASGWAALPSLPTPRSDLAVVVGPDGRVYAIGGATATGSSTACEAYDPSTGAWSILSHLPAPCTAPAAASAPDGRIYVLGGRDDTGAPATTAFAYTPATDAWTAVAPLSPAASGPAAVRLPGGRLVVLGGKAAAGTPTAAVQSYGPSVALSPASGPAGSVVVASGSNVPASAVVSVYLGPAGSGTLLGTATADATGSFSATVTIPATATAGTVTISIQDDRALSPASASFTVTP